VQIRSPAINNHFYIPPLLKLKAICLSVLVIAICLQNVAKNLGKKERAKLTKIKGKTEPSCYIDARNMRT
jgi:hypothetical protein